LNIPNKRKYDGSKIKVEKLVHATNWVKGMWQMNTYLEQYMSIIDGSRKCPNITDTEKASEDDRKKICWLGSQQECPGRRRVNQLQI
jgi:hypothetical protein